MLPPQYGIFRSLYDDAPSASYDQVEACFCREFGGLRPTDLFQTFDPNPVASASIAQVHRATLKDGTPVAVKIQKPQIRHQMEWDLATYKLLNYGMQWLFDLPLVHFTQYVQDHLRRETYLVLEGRNSERAWKDLLASNVPNKDSVYIPKVFWDYSTRSILTCGWIEGIRLSNIQKIKESRYSLQDILTTVVNVFSHQIFYSGFVHADPHIGNIIIRDIDMGRPQLVLLDHGLYVECGDQFRRDYCMFWKSLFTLDMETLERISKSWDIGDVQLFASATLQRPWKPTQALHLQNHSRPSAGDIYELQIRSKERLRAFLENTERMPKVLVLD